MVLYQLMIEFIWQFRLINNQNHNNKNKNNNNNNNNNDKNNNNKNNNNKNNNKNNKPALPLSAPALPSTAIL